jgi:hypothetical protein
MHPVICFACDEKETSTFTTRREVMTSWMECSQNTAFNAPSCNMCHFALFAQSSFLLLHRRECECEGSAIHSALVSIVEALIQCLRNVHAHVSAHVCASSGIRLHSLLGKYERGQRGGLLKRSENHLCFDVHSDLVQHCTNVNADMAFYRQTNDSL